MYRIYVSTIVFLFTLNLAAADTTTKDSLLSLLEKDLSDTVRCEVLHQLTQLEYDDNIWPVYNQEVREIAERNLNKKDLDPISEDLFMRYKAAAIGNQGYLLSIQGDALGAIEVLEEGLSIQRELNDSMMIAHSLINLGVMYKDQGDMSKAWDYYHSSLKILENISDTAGWSATLNNMGLMQSDQGNIITALEYYSKALALRRASNDPYGIANSLNNIGYIYKEMDSLELAIKYYQESLEINKQIDHPKGIATAYNSLAGVYREKGEHDTAMEYYEESLHIRKSIDDKAGVATVINNIGSLLYLQGDLVLAEKNFKKAFELSKELGFPENIRNSSKFLYEIYEKRGDTKKAYEVYKIYILMRDSIDNVETQKAAIKSELKYQYDKKALADKIEKEKNEAIAAEKIRRNKLQRNALLGGIVFALFFAGIFYKQKNRIRKEKQVSDDLLLNILPSEVADELKEKGSAQAKQFDSVTVLFTDFIDFTQVSEKLTPTELVHEIDHCFKAFDKIIGKYSIEKIKTIGDSYMAAAGLPVPNGMHAVDIVNAALDIQEFMEIRMKERSAAGQEVFRIRIGANTGQVVAGIVGVKKFAYDIWGDTVNVASRMESNSEAGKVNISESTFHEVKDHFECEYRGLMEIKGKGKIKTYFVSRKT